MLLNKVSNLKSQSENAMGAFKKALTSLQSINTQIEKVSKEKQAKVAALNVEREELESNRKANLKMIDKIQDFFN